MPIKIVINDFYKPENDYGFNDYMSLMTMVNLLIKGLLNRVNISKIFFFI